MPNVIRYHWIAAKHFTLWRVRPIEGILLHATEGHEAGDVQTLVGGDGRKVSVHWYVTKTGKIYHFVQDADTANHAGAVNDARFSNAGSIGIEQENIGGNDWSGLQIEAVANLVAFLMQKHGELPIAYHKDVAVPKGRKSDPQHYPRVQFDARLAEARKLTWTAEAVS